MSLRIEKVNELIRKCVNDIFLKEISFKEGVFVTIAKVDTSSDLRYTRVFLSIFPEKETHYVERTLQKEMYVVQGCLNKKLDMRPLPRIQFKTDLTEVKADKIEKLLKEI